MNNKKIHMVTILLLIVGGLNLGLMGAFNWGIGDVLGAGVTQVIYILIGLSALYEIATHKKCCGVCSVSSPASTPPPSSV